jgi:hypothetical protein
MSPGDRNGATVDGSRLDSRPAASLESLRDELKAWLGPKDQKVCG